MYQLMFSRGGKELTASHTHFRKIHETRGKNTWVSGNELSKLLSLIIPSHLHMLFYYPCI